MNALNPLRLLSLFYFFALGLPIAGFSQVSVPEDKSLAEKVSGIFEQHCIDCHSEGDANGSIRFDQLDTLFSEADSGQAAINLNQPAESQLLKRILSTSEDERMPPEGPRLAKNEIETIRNWIQRGAPYEKSASTNASGNSKRWSSKHWAFQPIQPPSLPTQKTNSKSIAGFESAIDYFIAARLQEESLTPVGLASPHQILRRASYDLTGLPPSEAMRVQLDHEIQEVGFPKAMSQLVDRLLSQPSYGERWGRHWMDWVRYADTAGDNSDYPIPEAYLYRNYIIDAFNQDMPYDQFLTEQLAGDLLSADTQEQRNRQVTATGYLAMARRFGSLIEKYPWHLTIEDTIDNLGKTVLGVTLACARCHDHKFDPISARDYYALYGIFESTDYPFPGIELFKAQDGFISLEAPSKLTEKDRKNGETTNKLRSKLDEILDKCRSMAIENTRLEKMRTVDEHRQKQRELASLELKARKAGEALAKHLRSLPARSTAYAVKDGVCNDTLLQIKGDPNRPGALVARGFPAVLGGEKIPKEIALQTSGRLQLAEWIVSPNNPLTARVIVNRVWQRHFGAGLVTSVNDFGFRGTRPSHPKLLDFLAHQLMTKGWSLKQLHREIMLSQTYCLSSTGTEENEAVDPTNRLLWRANRRRMDAESLRDTLLQLSGELDTSPADSAHPFPPKDQWEFTQHHPFKASYESKKRSVYLMSKRLTADRFFQTFDGPDRNVCTAKRDESVTALQALYFANDSFLHSQARRIAEKLVTMDLNNRQKIEHAISLMLCRPAQADEIDLLSEQLERISRLQPQDDSSNNELFIWSSLVRSILRLNEFIYID